MHFGGHKLSEEERVLMKPFSGFEPIDAKDKIRSREFRGEIRQMRSCGNKFAIYHLSIACSAMLAGLETVRFPPMGMIIWLLKCSFVE